MINSINNDKDFYNNTKSSNVFFIKPKVIEIKYEIATKNDVIESLEGLQKVNIGDFIVTGLENENYVIKKENFYSKYKIIHKISETIGVAKKIVNKDLKYECKKIIDRIDVCMNSEKFLAVKGNYIVRYGKNEFGLIENKIFDKLYQTI